MGLLAAAATFQSGMSGVEELKLFKAQSTGRRSGLLEATFLRRSQSCPRGRHSSIERHYYYHGSCIRLHCFLTADCFFRLTN